AERREYEGGGEHQNGAEGMRHAFFFGEHRGEHAENEPQERQEQREGREQRSSEAPPFFPQRIQPPYDADEKEDAEGPEKFRRAAHVVSPVIVAVDVEHKERLPDVHRKALHRIGGAGDGYFRGSAEEVTGVFQEVPSDGSGNNEGRDDESERALPEARIFFEEGDEEQEKERRYAVGDIGIETKGVHNAGHNGVPDGGARTRCLERLDQKMERCHKEKRRKDRAEPDARKIDVPERRGEKKCR